MTIILASQKKRIKNPQRILNYTSDTSDPSVETKSIHHPLEILWHQASAPTGSGLWLTLRAKVHFSTRGCPTVVRWPDVHLGFTVLHIKFLYHLSTFLRGEKYSVQVPMSFCIEIDFAKLSLPNDCLKKPTKSTTNYMTSQWSWGFWRVPLFTPQFKRKYP